ncbi:MAG: DUF423 domain-containing protein [Bacteriovoracaceae bacterium]
MKLNENARSSLLAGIGLLALAVMIGAFGAHGLKNIVAPEKLVTFETGVRYHFYHAFGLVLLGLYQLHSETRLKVTHWAFIVGILLFSFNCYFYAVSDIKVFAMIVPVGGTLFILGWVVWFWRILRDS